MVVNFLKNGRNLFIKKQSNILSAAVVLMIAVAASRVLGLVRDRLLAGTYFIPGYQWQLDVYFAAFRLPDMLFQLLVLGALSAAFIPVFSKLLVADEKQAWRTVSTVINLGSLVFALIALVIFIWTPVFCRLIAPNFSDQELSLMVSLTRLMLVAQLFFIISNILTGVLQSYQRFLIPALAPVIYNLGIIAGIIFLSPLFGIWGAALGVILGAFLHFLIQLPLALHLGFSWKPVIDLRSEAVHTIGKLMIPRTLALAVSQIELTVAVLIATSLPAGSLSIFYFAQHLNDLPVGLFGLTIGQAALPALSIEASKDKEGYKKILLSCLRQILYFSLPASVLLLILRIPIVRLTFGAKTFPWEATLVTGSVVAMFSLSIFAQSLIQVLIRAFYALHDTKTPFLSSLLAVFLNVFLSFIFVFSLNLQVLGLGLAVSFASIFQAFFLLYLLQKKTLFATVNNFLIPAGKMFLASLMMAIALWIPMRFLDRFVLDTTRTWNLLFLTLTAGISGMLVYLSLTYFLKIEELGKFLQVLRRFGAWREILASSSELLDSSKTASASTQND